MSQPALETGEQMDLLSRCALQSGLCRDDKGSECDCWGELCVLNQEEKKLKRLELLTISFFSHLCSLYDFFFQSLGPREG